MTMTPTPTPTTPPPRAPKAEFTLKDFFPYLVRMYYRDVSLSVREVYGPDYGLTAAEWRTLAVLHDYEPLSAKEIVARSSMDKVNVSRAVAGLQRAKLLDRHVDPTDRRRVLLRVTPQGRKVLRALVPRVLEVEARLLEGFTDAERDTLIALMQRVRDNAAALRTLDDDHPELLRASAE
ncbi:MarR family winged helix-turn-helix transcriptional regulator [Roseospira navarrensis]|uniref:MarR family transcriptional regulator n=1 Tax=Roseospira navarrensis TaxID=140058 RepID=A0A7X1ZDV2_9PROT|nr:MarR family transcriptional regulator [Roseospira navarrensis]MQX35582.1 MarR family transcriptional regulator [Roseospira navarrensis]